MAVITKELIASKNAETSQTTQYTASNVKAVIDKFSATNTSGSVINFSINLVEGAGSASTSNRVLNTQPILPDESYPCNEVVGHVLENGQFISTLATGSGLTIRASGREIS